jgi:hypothetical protein
MTTRALTSRVATMERKDGANKFRVVFRPYGLQGEALQAWETENLLPGDNGLTVIVVQWTEKSAEDGGQLHGARAV